MSLNEKRYWPHDYICSSNFKEVNEKAQELVDDIKEFVEDCIAEFMSSVSSSALEDLGDMIKVVPAKTGMFKFMEIVKAVLGIDFKQLLGVKERIRGEE